MFEQVNAKTTFWLGIAIGVAALSLLGFLGLLVVTFGPGASNQQVAAPSVPSNVVNNAPAQQPSQPVPPVPSAKADIQVTDGDQIRGNKNAPITVVEFSDFQCPYCSKFHDTMKQVMANFPDQVRWVYKHFPLDSIHPYARKAAEAAECAGEQSKFWEYTDTLMARQSEIGTTSFSTMAQDIGLNTTNFDTCLNSGKYASKVEADYQLGVSNGVQGTPGNFINGISVAGAVPYQQIESVINSLLQ